MKLPGVCQDCRRPVHWNGFRWINDTPKGTVWTRHACPMRCAAWMPQAADRCGRKPNHMGECRSRYALDNAARARRKWAA